jgi:hypothetical protein
MQVFAVGGIVAALRRSAQRSTLSAEHCNRSGRDLAFVDPRYPDSMQALGTAHLEVVCPGAAKAVNPADVY